MEGILTFETRSTFFGPPVKASTMAFRSRLLSASLLAAFVVIGALDSAIPSQTLSPSFPKAILDLKESVVRGLGKQAEGFEITGFDARDALVGQSVAYEFHVQVDNKVFPVKLLEDVSRWEFVDLPMFREGDEEEGDGKELAEVGKVPRSQGYPVLAPFELAGPMELWIQDGDDMRLSLPHDVDAGVLKKVVLSDGAVVTVKGARSVSLRHPIELPLPLNRSNYKGRPIASGLLTLADALRHASRSNEKPLLSLRIVGPTSLTSSSATSSKDRLKLKRLAPGLVELSSPSVPAIARTVEELEISTMWPLTSFNGSDMNLRGFEELLASVLGEKGREEGSFQLLKADVSTRTYVKLNFAMARRLSVTDLSGFPEWKTQPEKVTSNYEVLARVEDDGKIVPERIAEVQPYEAQETVLGSVLTGNVTMSSVPVGHPPPVYFTL